MSSYFLKLGFDNPEVVKQLDCLAAKYNLTTFVKIAVESLLSSDEGKRLVSALGAKEPTKRKKKGSVVQEKPIEEVVQNKNPGERPLPVPVADIQKTESEKSESKDAPELYSTDRIMCQILKRVGE